MSDPQPTRRSTTRASSRRSAPRRRRTSIHGRGGEAAELEAELQSRRPVHPRYAPLAVEGPSFGLPVSEPVGAVLRAALIRAVGDQL